MSSLVPTILAKSDAQCRAVIFENDSKPYDMTEGGMHATDYLRVNTAGDLVVQSDWLIEGKLPNRTMPVREFYTNWIRATRIGAP